MQGQQKGKQIKVSIVTIFLNAGQFIQEAIESVLAQTCHDWELLLVDDGSSDGSTMIAKKYAGQFPDKIRYLDHPGHRNHGMSASRNLGIRSSKGEYVALLDADDVFLPEKLERQVDILDRHPRAAMVYGPTFYWYGWTRDTEDIKRDRTAELGVTLNSIFEPPQLMIVYLTKGGDTIPCTCAMMIRKNILEEVGGFEENFKDLYEDQVFLAKVALRYPVYVQAGSLDKYRQHPGSCCWKAIQSQNSKSSVLHSSGSAYFKWLSTYISVNKIFDKKLKAALNNSPFLLDHMPNDQPMVSVIIPAFNGASFISKAIESVFNQTFMNFEIIVVDDGSSDNTKVVLEDWIKQGAIQYVYQENKGLAAARNTGIRHSKGQYLKFLDCDDVLCPEQLERQVKHLDNKPPLVISATGYELEFENKNKIPIQLYLKENQTAQLISGNPCPVHTLLVHREIIEQVAGFDEALRSHEDSDLWLRILGKGGRIEKLDYIGCSYRIIAGALSSNTNQMFLNRCKFSEKLNLSLMPELYELDAETLRELFWANANLVDQCYAREIKPVSAVPVALQVNRKIYGMKLKTLDRLFFNLRGYENMAQKEYKKACRIDPHYPKKLMNTAWRDEKFYKRDKFQYMELLPRNKKVKNVLYLNSSAVMYGAETRLIDIVRNLDNSRFHPFVLLPHPGPLDDRLKELGVITMHLEYGFPLSPLNRSNIIRFLRLNRDFVRLVRRHDIDVIHANLHINMSKFWLAFLVLRIPLIVHMRSHFWLRNYEKFVICRASKAIFISRFVEREFHKKRRYDFLMFHRRDHAEILHDGIDINRFSPYIPAGQIRKELKISPEDFMVGIIGAVDKIKGQDLLLKAANIVVPKHPHAKFVIVGDLYHPGKSNIEYRDALVKMIKDFHLTENVIFTGFRKDIETFMADLDLLVQPSEREALGTSMVEAMSCGKPVIGTDVDGIPEVIGNNEGGILLNPRTPKAFAEAINFFIENPQEARKRGMQGRERALKLFNVFENIKQIQGLYHQALGDQW